ncbi:hypothetical protein R1flu_009892 [Riccia fluitans]|uniref:Uncharacterized protein n=1 Tax=Riccia fluitans TaxID=41844 RepID=A0ABD1Z472_9MARC
MAKGAGIDGVPRVKVVSVKKLVIVLIPLWPNTGTSGEVQNLYCGVHLFYQMERDFMAKGAGIDGAPRVKVGKQI